MATQKKKSNILNISKCNLTKEKNLHQTKKNLRRLAIYQVQGEIVRAMTHYIGIDQKIVTQCPSVLLSLFLLLFL